MRKYLLGAFALAALVGVSASAPAQAHEGVELMTPGFSFDGFLGRYDKAALARGFQVFHEVCSNCHSLNLIAYRNLAAVGLTEDEIKAVAAERQKQDGPADDGTYFQRPGRPADAYIAPFPNDKAAAATYGAAPPDLSLMAKARKGGPNYIYSLLLGFEDTPPEGVTVPDGKYYNKYFSPAISMPPPIQDDAVTYKDGTKATKEQIAKDVSVFLNWAAEPELDARKSLGLKVLGFLAVLTVLLYALKRQIWKDVHH
jgi:cytochrome c1